MEFEFNSNNSAPISRGGDTLFVVPSRGPGDGDAFVSSNFGSNDSMEYTDEFFDYPLEISERITQVSGELLRLRDALVVEQRCLNRESVEVAALTSLDVQRQAQKQMMAQTHAQAQAHARYDYEDTTSMYEPQDIAYVQAEKRRQKQEVVQKERYMKQMMEVEMMCSEEFFRLNSTRAKVDQLNREVSDWRLANGQTTGFNLYPMEVMRSSEGNCHGMEGGRTSTPGRFNMNQPTTTHTGIRSVPNVSSMPMPMPDMMSLSSRHSFDPDRPWVQTFAGAPCHVPRGNKDGNWRSGDAQERIHPIIHF